MNDGSNTTFLHRCGGRLYRVPSDPSAPRFSIKHKLIELDVEGQPIGAQPPAATSSSIDVTRSVAKSRLIAECGARVEAGDLSAVDDIVAHILSNPAFAQVIAYFSLTRQDVEAIIIGVMVSGYGARYGQHFVPVSAVLFPDTLAYLLRAERGQVSKGEAYFQVSDHFRRGGLVFEPERAFHR
jgi:hypothetical protein